jgi:predicted flap endonuclease-1-like 5' DNA nuclease
MSYLLNELLLYLLAAGIIGALVGWFMRNCSCNNALADLRSEHDSIIETKENELNAQADELEATKTQLISYKTQYRDIQSKYASQSGDLMLMTSRWQTTLKKAKQLPTHQTWIKNLQNKYQQTLRERNDFENLACQYVDKHAEANQKIKRLNKHVTDQEAYKFRLTDMIGKVQSLNGKVTSSENNIRSLYGMVGQVQSKWRSDRQEVANQKIRLTDMTGKVVRLNSKVTSSENSIRSLYGMVGQVQSKWRHDRLDTERLRELHPALEQQAHAAKAELHAYKTKADSEIQELQKLRNKDLADQNVINQTELSKFKKRVDELTPLEQPNNDNKFNRFLDKVRLAGTSKNNVLGRTYKQINEIKLESSEKERVFVDTCEEKDAIIDDLRDQVRTAENRAQASSAAAVQEYKGKLSSLESELASSKQDLAMLREHKQTIEAFKSKLALLQAGATKPAKPTPAKAAKKKAEKTTQVAAKKPKAGLNAPSKGLNIAAATVKDDLQVVKGIGPVMEKKLNEFGVYSYEQLGRLKAADIETLATTLGSFPDRISRDEWVKQSKKLFKKKYGQKLD